MDTQPNIKKKKGISPVWTLPIIAILICAWLLYKSFVEAGIEIEVYFSDASGITPEKTQIMAMGLPLGKVKAVHPDIENRRVRTVIIMDRSTEPYLVEDTKFWIVKPEVSASRITGLGTLLSGSYIGAQRGKSQKSARSFVGLSSSPPVPANEPGLHITLKSSALRSLQEGSDIYFRNVKIGSVQTYKLQEDESVSINCFILPQYSKLIHSGSRFYDASGITFSGKLTNLKIRVESLASLFVGGIVVSTPDELQDTSLAKNGDVFTLYEDFAAANYGITMTLRLASGAGITEGVTKVMYRGLEAGYVKHISINDDQARSVTAHILLDPRAEIILREKTEFWLVSPDISVNGISNLDTLISGPYITFKPGEGAFRDHFEILETPPVLEPLRPGKKFVLSARESTFPANSAPIYFRSMKIGEVIGSELSSDRKTVETSIYIYEPYTDIVTSESVFITASGITIDANFRGFSMQVEPLAALVKGGVNVVNPPGNKLPEASAGAIFTLFPDYDTALNEMPALKPAGLYLQLRADTLGSLQVGSPILYKKINVGRVIGYKLDKKDTSVLLSCFIKDEYAHLVNKTSIFYDTSGIKMRGSLLGVSVETGSLESILTGGISFITTGTGAPVSEGSTFTIFKSLEQAYEADNISITVRFSRTIQLETGAPVRYQGIQIGLVRDISFADDLKSIITTLSIDPQYATFFRQETKIWVAAPQISLSGVKNLATVVSGSFVVIKPGSGALVHDVVGLDSPPPQPLFTYSNGLNITLESAHLGSIAVDSPVYYRQVEVGKVTGYNLAADFKGVLIYVTIDQQYAAIIRENTRFWNASGVTVKGGIFSGITVSTQSLQSIVTGGIALATPGKEDMGKRVYTGYHFLLHDEPQEGWLDWSPDIFTVEKEKGVPIIKP